MTEEERDHIGPIDEVQKAKEHIAQAQDYNDELVVTLLNVLRVRLLEDKASLESIHPASPHLLTKFLIDQAINNISVAERLVTAALDLNPSDAQPKKIENKQIEGKNIEDLDEGTGQYL